MLIFMKLAAFIAGAVGLVLLCAEPYVGIMLLAVGALLILVTSRTERQNAEQAKLDEEREWRQQMLDAQRGQQPPQAPARRPTGETDAQRQAREARKKLGLD